MFICTGRCHHGWDLRLSDPAGADTECFQIFLNTVSKQYSKDLILLLVDGAGNHGSDRPSARCGCTHAPTIAGSQAGKA
jgi:hypothetical protein